MKMVVPSHVKIIIDDNRGHEAMDKITIHDPEINYKKSIYILKNKPSKHAINDLKRYYLEFVLENQTGIIKKKNDKTL